MLNRELDTMNYKRINNPKAQVEVHKLNETLDLIDIFRENNPTLGRYTWRKRNPIKQGRLDFFLILQSFLSLAPQIKFENSYRSDHSPVVLIFKTNEFKRGKGFWKFNNSLLTDKDYVKLIKDKICEVKLQYACLVYNRELIPEIDNDIIFFTVNDQIFLDILLMEIRGKTISYSTFKKKNASKRESQLEKEILILEQNLGKQSLSDLTSKQNELENIRKERLKGQCLRSRSKVLYFFRI